MIEPAFRPINRAALAEEVGVDPAHISRVLNPKTDIWPSVPLARRMAEALGCTVDALIRHLREQGKPEPHAEVARQAKETN